MSRSETVLKEGEISGLGMKMYSHTVSLTLME